MPDTIVFPDVVKLAVPLFIIAMLGEIGWIRLSGRGGRYETRDTLTSLLMGAGNVATGLVLGFVAYGYYTFLWQFAFFDLGVSVLVIVAAFLLDDLTYYWQHRLGHEVRWVWASHVNHHSSQHFNLSTALRQTWTGTFTGMMLLSTPMILLGFHPKVILFCNGINLVYQFWIHTEAIGKLPRWFEFIFNTPSHHRVHHGRNARYLDANYAGTLIIWDRMFGTFVPEQEDEPVDYGLVHNLGTFNPLRVAFHEWLGIFRDIAQPGLTLRQRLAYMFAAPGWSHDGSRDTSTQIKRKYVAANPDAAGKPGL
ncbi:sterol desaturase family protein [Oceanomicrobium pacificus]|uniref:Sterol desaturase family protein n=1 Tax=Oceanomicrobium pacificus TaxID=2692916 RepID=A0A6B0TQH3_9RHOB|nr:sterol desaturase family protein [Oceanomicrobium pacificus]MXU64939.1 sterol desaturase family protein [Oceanomicrobium pacificus]